MREAIIAAFGAGDMARAERLCLAGLRGHDVPEAIYLLAAVRSRQGDHVGACKLFAAAAAFEPTRTDISFNFGIALRDAGHPEAALAEWQRLLTLDPNHVAAWRNIGMAHMDAKREDLAYAAFMEALNRKSDDADSLFQIGVIHYNRGEVVEAEAYNLRLLTITPEDYNGWTNLGECLKDQGKLEAATQCFLKAIELNSSGGPARFNYGSLLLSQGRWREGFAHYEWRHTKPQHFPPALTDVPEWTGNEPAGTTVLLWNDQGNGDVLHFLRFVPDVIARGHRVTLVMAEPMVRLTATIPGLTAMVVRGQPLPRCDVQISLASLPAALAIDDPAATWRGPYLSVNQPSPILKIPGRLAVGLVWAGEPTYPRDHERSIALANLEPLLDVRGIDWYSLQVGERARSQMAASRWQGRLQDCGAGVRDFADTAALMQGLDLFITVDTGVAHLAGALGRPTWLMLRTHGDWRWRFSGETSEWYPSLRLFRQVTRGHWASVIEDVRQALQVLSEKSSPHDH